MLKALTIHDLRHITGLALSRDTYPGTDLPTLRSTITELHPQAQTELCALMYFGRGDFGSDFSLALEHARRLKPEDLVRTVASKAPSLPTYLMTGIAMLAGEDVVPYSSACEYGGATEA